MTYRGQKYFPMSDAWVNEHASDLLIMEGHGWSFDHTGGGCTAMQFIKGDLYLIISDDDLCVPSSKGGEVVMGLVKEDPGVPENYIGDLKYMTWQELLTKKADEWFTELLGQENA